MPVSGTGAPRKRRAAYSVALSKRTSGVPSPRMARKRSSEDFVIWILRRVTEQPEARRGNQTSESSNLIVTLVNRLES
jgi:hypothetical protein